MEKCIDDLAMVETADNGGLIRSHGRGVVPRVAHNFRFFADFLIDGLHDADFETRGHRNHVSRDPAGVCVLISPWNAPLMLATWKIAPALAAGNTVVLTPSEWSPLTASLLADIARDAGLPDGVLNVVQGLGVEAGAAVRMRLGSGSSRPRRRPSGRWQRNRRRRSGPPHTRPRPWSLS